MAAIDAVRTRNATVDGVLGTVLICRGCEGKTFLHSRHRADVARSAEEVAREHAGCPGLW